MIINGWLSSSSCFLVTTEALLNQKEPKNGKELDGGKAELMAHNNCGIEPSQSLELQLKLIMLEPTLARTCRELPEGGTQLGTPKNSWKDSCMSGVFDKNWSTGTINVYESQRCNKELESST